MATETQKVDVLAVLNTAANDWSDSSASKARAADAAHDAVSDLIEAASLRIESVNRSWYVVHPDGVAFSGAGHATEAEARKEGKEALNNALERIGTEP